MRGLAYCAAMAGGATDEMAHDVLLAVGEVLSNAARHAYPNTIGSVEMDYRLTEDGRIFLLEANTNAQIARNEDFADSAAHAGVKYEALLQKIINLGMSYETGMT